MSRIPSLSPGLRSRSPMERRGAARVTPSSDTPVRVTLRLPDGRILGPRGAWDVSETGLSLGALFDETKGVHLGLWVEVVLAFPNGRWSTRGRVAHLSELSHSPVWPALVGVVLDPADQAEGRAAYGAVVKQLVAARDASVGAGAAR